MKTIQIQEFGGPEVLVVRDLPQPGRKAGHVTVRVEAAGVNFIDVYQRTGLYKNPLPFVPGMEGAGVVTEVGEDVEGFVVGDRVAWCMSLGGYAEFACVPARVLVKVPEVVSTKLAATVLLQGLTAHYLVRSTFPLQPGQVAVIHAAAGGVGLLLVQMAAALGATIIATTSTDEKAALVREAGAQHVVLYTKEDFQEVVRNVTEGKGADVVYDSVGATTFARSLKCLKPRGLLVTFGQSSGPVEPLSLLELSSNGSLFVTRPTLAHYMLDREEIDWRAGELFASLIDGRLRPHLDREYQLADAGKAHQALESRATAGKLLVLP